MDKDIIANIKGLSLDMINYANSGHPGIVLSSAPIIYTLYKNHLDINPNKPNWYNRDRFILSAGHGSALLYSTLFMVGYNLSIDDLKKFRTINSITPGHPEFGITPGVECSTGPLGQGIATAVGIALGTKILKEQLKIEKEKQVISPIDFKTYVLVGDGDLMEGISYEACSLAGTLCLDNLIVLYDSNNMTLDGSTDNTFKEDKRKRFEAMGFDTFYVSDGNDLTKLNNEINKAKKSKKPAFIEIKTHLGYGSKMQDTNKVHGTPLDEEDLVNLKNKLHLPSEPFYINTTLKRDLIAFIANRVGDKYNRSMEIYDKYIKNNLDSTYKDISYFFLRDQTYDLSKINWNSLNDKKSLRDVNKYVLNNVASLVPSIIGGSADLSSSTKTYLEKYKDITKDDFNGRNIWYGIREHSMGAISNGLALLGFRPFNSTFLTFSDYLKPAIRMSSLMNLPVTYIFTHDSITIGKDGPTHQPVEQLSSLRSIPNLNVYRPCDLKEIIGCWQSILDNQNNPSCLIISRSNEVKINNTSVSKTLNGAYIVKDYDKIDGIIMATGTEVVTALKISLALEQKDIYLRVVSAPSLEVFDKQSLEYKNKMLTHKKIIVLEASNSLDFTKYTSYENLININKFGKSGSEEDVLKYMNFDIENILNKVINILKH